MKPDRIVINPTARSISLWFSRYPFCIEIDSSKLSQVMRYLFRTKSLWQNPRNFQRVTIYERKPQN